MTRQVEVLQRAAVVAVIRAPSADAAVRAVAALVTGGIRGIEITYSTPDAAKVIAELDRVKIFPASLGGPGYLRALRAPFPDVALMPTGGVNADNLADWFDAGAADVGAGSELCSPAAMRAGRWEEIEQSARRFATALRGRADHTSGGLP
jgi:2-keto-3-deoxy-6-phosphogluconate aldolase